jgi:hypothetical protein
MDFCLGTNLGSRLFSNAERKRIANKAQELKSFEKAVGRGEKGHDHRMDL